MSLNYKIAVASLGCAKNLVDTENMLGLLAEEGYTFVSAPEEADVILVNTCAFIGDAKEESIQTILDMAQYKENGSCKCLVVTGCLAERYHEDIKKELPEVDAIVGTGDFPAICAAIRDAMSGTLVCRYGNSDTFPLDNMPRIVTTPQHVAYLKIAEGCDNHCTYCVIPALRGKYRSRTMEDILDEARHLSDGGVKELILIAQDTTRYGEDLYGKPMLPQLLKELCKIEAVAWIRLHYCYPEAVSDELIDTIAAEKKLLHYFDIPIQHANDNILKRMGRKTNKAQLVTLINKIRAKMPDAAVRTSLIVGFPGETRAEFQELFDFTAQMRLDRVGVFAYSKEENTPAARLDKQVDKRTKERRREKLMALAQVISLEKNEEKVGTVIEVICDGFDEESLLYYGRSYADSLSVDSLVYFGARTEVLPGQIVPVKVLCAQEYDLMGEMVL